MELDDLDLVSAWLTEPHMARWYLAGSTVEQEVAELRDAVTGGEPTHVLVVLERNRPVGWCQWFFCHEYPDHAAGVGAYPGDIGIDYAIGDPASTGRGVGTAMIVALVAHIRRLHPTAGVITDPEASNLASRRVLEKNHFRLLGERPVASESTPAPMAIYRLPPADD
jgi:aminoglycoside 6'-N-acetyltransferase